MNEGDAPTAEAAFVQTTEVRQRSPWLYCLPAVPMLVALALAASARSMVDFWVSMGCLGTILFLGIAASPPQSVRRLRVRADARGLWADGRLLKARERMAAAILEHRDGAVICTCSGPMGLSPIEVDVTSEDEGRRLLRALSFDVSQRTVRFMGPSPLMTSPARRGWVIGALALVVVAALLPLVLSEHGFAGPMSMLLFASLTWLVAGGMVDVGADGVLLRSLWSRRFVPYEQIARVEPARESIRLVLHDGRKVDLWVGSHGGAALRTRVRNALGERISAELGERAQSRPLPPEAAMVAREGRTAREWLDHLRQLVGGSGSSYREGAVARDRLWRIAEDASAPAAARAGAAVALSTGLRADERQRLRIAAEAAAAPDVRAALEAAAEENLDEGELVRALEPMVRRPPP